MAMAVKVTRAMGGVKTDPMAAGILMQQIAVAHEAVQGLKEWPTQRISELKRQLMSPEVNMSRRGPGL